MLLLAPNGEKVRAALAFVLEHRVDSSMSLSRLCDEAGMRFNLSPLDVQALEHALSRSGPMDEGSGTAQGDCAPSALTTAGADPC